MIPTIRIFVSSPGDVYQERIAAERVIKRLRDRYASDAIIVPVMWEHEPITANNTFQPQIDKYINPADCDVVVFLLWARLGTPFIDSDGTKYPSGTVKEFWSSFERHQQDGCPDILIYKKTSTFKTERDDAAYLKQVASQKESLEQFMSQLLTEEGLPKHAYLTFEDVRQFEETFEIHLEKMIERKLFGEVSLNPTWDGNPFLGLRAFNLEHAPVYFGRQVAVLRAFGQLKNRAEAGIASLLVVGASGSGKSSLARSGLASKILSSWPDLPHVIIRPGATSPESPIADLAQAIEQAIPEIKPFRIRDVLEENPAAILNILNGIRRSTDNHETSRPQLFLVVDQLEEVLTLGAASSEQRKFAIAVELLARSGLCWCVATLRSDYYSRLIAIPEFAHFIDNGGIFDLQPPTKAEIGQMIRRPARAAGLYFEEDRETGQTLDDLIRDETGERSEILPLLGFTLEELYLRRSENGQLTFKAYNQLGGIEGSVSRRADEVYQKQPAEVQDALSRVFRQLVTVSIEDSIPARQRCLDSQFDQDTQARQLVDAFVESRLLQRDVQHGKSFVEIVHEAILDCWLPLSQWLNTEGELLRKRSRLLESFQRWEQNGRRADLLLPSGKALDEANEVAEETGLLVGQELQNYVIKSRRSVARRRRLAILGVVAVGLFAIAASVASAVAVWRGNTLERTVDELGEKKKELEVTIDDLNAAKLESESKGAMARDAARETSRELGNSHYLLSRIADNVEQDPIKSTHFLYTAATDYAKAEDAMETRMHLLGIERSRFGLDRTFPNSSWVVGSKLVADGKHLLTWCRSGTIRLWDVQQATVVKEFNHEAAVLGATMSCDLARLLTWGEDGTARLWDVQKEEEFRQFRHEGKPIFIGPKFFTIYGARLFAEGKLLLTWSNDGTARLWDVWEGVELQQFRHEGVTKRRSRFAVVGVELLAGNSRLLTWGSDGTVRLWDTMRGTLLKRFDHQSHVRGAKLLSDEQRLLTWGYGPTVRLWSVNQGTEIMKFKHTNALDDVSLIYGVQLFADNSRLLSWDSDGTVVLWDIEHGIELKRFKHEKAVIGARLLLDGSRILTWSVDGTARLWDIEKQTELKRFKHTSTTENRSQTINGAELFDDGSRLLTWSSDGTARLWDIEKQIELNQFSHEDEIVGAKPVFGESRILTWSHDGTTRLWCCQQKSELMEFKHGSPVDGVQLLSGKGVLLTWGVSEVRLWDIDQAAELQRFNCYGGFDGAHLLPDGKQLLTWNNELGAPVLLWNAENGTELQQFNCRSFFRGAELLSDSRRLMTWDYDGSVRLWDVQQGIVLRQFQHKKAVNGAHLLQGDSRLLTWSDDGTSRLWDVEKGTELKRFEHEGANPDDDSGRSYVLGAELVANGSRLLTRSSDKTVRLWDVHQETELKRFKHDSLVYDAKMLSDGSRLLTCSGDAARLWEVAQEVEARKFIYKDGIYSGTLISNGTQLLTRAQFRLALWDVERETLMTEFSHGRSLNGSRLVSGDRRLLTWASDGTARLWDVQQGIELKRFQHEDSVNGATFVSDASNSRLITWSDDGMVRIWDVDTKVPLERRLLEWQVRSATKIDEQTGNYRMLSHDEWEVLQRKLFRDYGGFLDTKVISTAANQK